MGMESTSREYAKFKRQFVGPRLTRKQKIAMSPPMPAESPNKYPKICTEEFSKLSPNEQKKALWSAYVVERRKKRDKSMPLWADKKNIKDLYIQARILTLNTGIKHEVDHIIPSTHELVCGLHVLENLQILTKFNNQLKSNQFDID